MPGFGLLGAPASVPPAGGASRTEQAALKCVDVSAMSVTRPGRTSELWMMLEPALNAFVMAIDG
jgi:hypothetical protein